MSQWVYRDGVDEAPAPNRVEEGPKQRHELLALSLLLSIGVVGWDYLFHLWVGAADHHGLAAVDHGIRDVVLSLPMAFVAVGAGQWLTRRQGLTGPVASHTLIRASVISLVFAVLLIPSVGVHHLIDGYLDGGHAHTGGGLEHDTSPAGLVLHGLRDALIGQAVALPLLYAAIALLSGGTASHGRKHAEQRGAGKAGLVQSRNVRQRFARQTVAALGAVTLGIVFAGAFLAVRVVSGDANIGSAAHAADSRVPTSFGALWVDSYRQIAIPRTVHKGHVGVPQGGSPDKVAIEVTVRLANTTAAPVELTPARFALRVEHFETPISAEGASFESVGLVPGAYFDARVQFPVEGGEHELMLLFDDPDGSGRIKIDLGRASFPETGDDSHEGHDGHERR
jgi:hypothetical protein